MAPTTVRSYCRFCVALCGVMVTVDGDEVVAVRGDPDDPISNGYTCPKGRALPGWHHHPRRLDHPMVRGDGRLTMVSWDEALDDLAERLAEVMGRIGPDGIGLYNGTGSAFDGSGRRLGERWHRLIGSRSKYSSGTIDAPCKPYVAELVAGHPGVVPAPDRERPGLVLLVGINPVASHGHLNAFPDPVTTLRDLATRGDLWVIDPRRTESARIANGHIAPRPGTDYVVLGYLVRELLRHGADHDYLEEHADGVERLTAAVEPFDVDAAAMWCDVPQGDLEALLAAVRRRGTIAGQSGTGPAMSVAGNVTEWLLWALQIVTRSFDHPGGSWFHPGYLRALDQRSPAPRAGEARNGEHEPGPKSRPLAPRRLGEYPVSAIYDEIEAGNLRALLVAGGNPTTAFPDRERTERALRGLDVLAVLDVVETAATEAATHVLPVAGQLERADLPHFVDQFLPVIATRYTPAVVPPVADRKPMWWVFAALGERMGVDVVGGDRPPGAVSDDDLTDDDLLFALGERSRAESFERIRSERVTIHEPAQAFGWVHEGVLPGGRWRVAPEPLVAQLAQLVQLDESTDPQTPVLIPMRQLRHLNSQLTDGAGLTRRDQPAVHLHPVEAARAGVGDGERVTVRSNHGAIETTVCIDEGVRPGAVAIPHGYEFPNLGDLTTVGEPDPHTGMVLLSGVPVVVEPCPGR